jgi:predicted nucleic acid-binding protein
MNFIKSIIIEIKEENIIECGKLYCKEREKRYKFGIIDAIILSIARKHNAKILTKDNDFKDFKEAIII